jgi:DNA-binding CsgD family transcriptional regulator
MPDLPDLEDRLAAQALGLASDMRYDLAAAHRSVRALSRLEVEQVCCVLAAMVPVDVPLQQLAWWRLDTPPPPAPAALQPCGTSAALSAPRRPRRDALSRVRGGDACGVGRAQTGAAEGVVIRPLSPRETSVLQLIAEGATNKEIAERLLITAGTTRTYVEAVLAKLGARSRSHAAAIGVQAGLITVEVPDV